MPDPVRQFVLVTLPVALYVLGSGLLLYRLNRKTPLRPVPALLLLLLLAVGMLCVLGFAAFVWLASNFGATT